MLYRLLLPLNITILVVLAFYNIGLAQDDALSHTDLATPRLLGDENAPIILHEYSSFTCPHCRGFHRDILPIIKERYIDSGQVAIRYVDFPLDGLALAATIVARCVSDDKYFNFVELIFKRQDSWARAQDAKGALYSLANLAGAPSHKVDACLANDAAITSILERKKNDQAKYNITGTPSLLYGDTKLDISSVDNAIDSVEDILAQ